MTSVEADSYDVVAPRASALIESLRAFSYDLPAALADLVDNAVTADAENVWIELFWNGDESTISITDDGHGMTEEVLVAAMRPGSQSPLEKRSPTDLGRFGLGLKTASFSQCRRVTVRSKVLSGPVTTRCWDLDHVAAVDQWQLLRGSDAASEAAMGRLAALPHGSAVVWQKLDRLTRGHGVQSDEGQRRFLERAERVAKHLSMVFHEVMRGRGATIIHVNGRILTSWDPYLEEHPATQTLPATRLALRDASVEVRPYVLPHHSKLSEAEFRALEGPRGWNAHQGFYVYRRRRLLVAGDWLGLGWPRDEHHKLARIRVDFPNVLDADWGLDVTKSRAFPPPELRDDLRAIGERTRRAAKLVFSYRGARLAPRADEARTMLWEPTAKHDRVSYRLNREHPVLQRVLASTGDPAALATFLKLVEETVPHAHITVQNAEQPRSLQGPFENATEAQVREVMRDALRCLRAGGYSQDEAVRRLSTLWPFELFPALLQTIAESET